jgi:hypothetical protein
MSCNYDTNDLICKINNLQNQLYGNVYKTTLPDKLIYFLPAHVHKLKSIKGYTFLSPTGEEIVVSFKLFPDKSIQLESNLSMQGCTLILF